jgi:hypothetical protein
MVSLGCDDVLMEPPPPGGPLAGIPAPPPPPPPGGMNGGEMPLGGIEGGTPGNEPYPDFGTPPPLDICDNYVFRDNDPINCSTVADQLCSPDGVDPVEALACASCFAENGYPAFGNEGCPEICDDGLDNDGDTVSDCDDTDCYQAPNCQDDPPPPPPVPQPAETCMGCHNGSQTNDYSGNGITNPHPFQAQPLKCTQCHGGNPAGAGKLGSHVTPPPAIGDRQKQIVDPKAFFNRVTLSGIDKLEPANYPANGGGCDGDSCSNLDYLQFINPGDLRVVAEGRGCGAGGCHGGEHVDWVTRSSIATASGFFSTTRFITGQDNLIPEYRIDDEGNTLADTSPRAVENPLFNPNQRTVGEVGRLIEQPEVAQFNGPMFQNAGYDANTLNNDIDNNTDPNRPNRIRSGSNLATLVNEQINITCGDCHLYSAGANNRYGDFRSSGCSACHMQYSLDGRSRSTDPNVPKNEPADPDQIAPGERSHISDHIIRNVSKVNNGVIVRGITDNACVGCHQGSNRTVLQFWGIRLDQNADLTNDFQYPDNPVTFTNTANDRRLFDPAVNNNTFNGRNADQYILTEDYDGDTLDDTPADIHYESGMGCIDCHGSRDLHGGTAGDVTSGKIQSRQDQSTAITCESCHGGIDEYAPTVDCKDYQKQDQQCVVDRFGNALKHVVKDPNNNFWLTSRVYGTTHYVPQTRDLTYNTNKAHPRTGQLLFSPKAAYAMGRIGDGIGAGPQQTNVVNSTNGFTHTDNLDCSSCHASWTNNCIGCHLKTEYVGDEPAEYFFSNITGERILLKEANADFVYQTPLLTVLGVNSKGYITQIDPAEKMFYRYQDLNDNESNVFAFSDRNGNGNNPNIGGRNAFPALAMNQMSPHSIRGRIDPTDNAEGLRYCVTCHLTENSLDNFGDEYALFRDLYYNNDFAGLVDNGFFDLLQEHIGRNTSNQLDSPFFVHMAAGLGTSLFMFDANGCPVNPLDNNPNRQYCDNNAPADIFDVNNVVYDLDRIVEFATGQTNATNAHPRLDLNQGPRRDGDDYKLAGPLNRTLLEKLTDPVNGLVLDSWLDADGNEQGDAADYIYAQ